MIDVKAVARLHEDDIRRFRRCLFAGQSDTSPWLASSARTQAPLLPRLGPLQSVKDPQAALTVVAGLVDLSVIMEDRTAKGAVLTLSVAAHHRARNTRLPVEPDEAAAWIREILGEEWVHHVHEGGPHTTTPSNTAPPVMSRYFMLFLDEKGKSCRPQSNLPGPLTYLMKD